MCLTTGGGENSHWRADVLLSGGNMERRKEVTSTYIQSAYKHDLVRGNYTLKLPFPPPPAARRLKSSRLFRVSLTVKWRQMWCMYDVWTWTCTVPSPCGFYRWTKNWKAQGWSEALQSILIILKSRAWEFERQNNRDITWVLYTSYLHWILRWI